MVSVELVAAAAGSEEQCSIRMAWDHFQLPVSQPEARLVRHGMAGEGHLATNGPGCCAQPIDVGDDLGREWIAYRRQIHEGALHVDYQQRGALRCELLQRIAGALSCPGGNVDLVHSLLPFEATQSSRATNPAGIAFPADGVTPSTFNCSASPMALPRPVDNCFCA